MRVVTYRCGLCNKIRGWLNSVLVCDGCDLALRFPKADQIKEPPDVR